MKEARMEKEKKIIVKYSCCIRAEVKQREAKERLWDLDRMASKNRGLLIIAILLGLEIVNARLVRL
ncbi:hypothetical protein PV325_001038, partial [Microctonus aethiopoides]